MSAIRQVQILCLANLRMARSKVSGSFRQSKLLVATVGVFSVAYLVLGYYLFSSGLLFLANIPAIGSLANERILHLLYFFFFVMLVFSNGIISYASLFRNRTTAWLLTLPVEHRSVFIYRILETLVISSWGLVFLSAPLLASFGKLYHAPWIFYLKALAAYIPFLVVPGALASWLVIIIIRWLNKWWLIIGTAVLIFFAVRAVIDTTRSQATAGTGHASATLTFDRILEHTRISTHPFIPSTWMSRMLLRWSEPVQLSSSSSGTFHFLLTSSYACMAGLITCTVFSRGYYGAWIRSVRRRAARSLRQSSRKRRLKRAFEKRPRFDWLPISIQTRALVRKDALTFMREPSQWAQVSIIFGLLFLYVLNLGNIGLGFDSPFWLAIICYLNLTVCALALSTLTTRFIFPMFSLEGRRLWILGLAPFSLDRVVYQKFWTGFTVTGAATLVLMAVSGVMLDIPVARTLYFMFIIFLMSFSLTALAVGLGTVFPNLRESNPAKIVSGFGGTLCLILSFVYIVLTITAIIIPEARGISLLPNDSSEAVPLPEVRLASPIAATLIASAFSAPPLILAIKRVKNLDFFGNL